MTVLVTLAFIMLAPVPPPASLQWKLAKGDQFYTRSVVDGKGSSTIQGKETAFQQLATTYHCYRVLAADEKGYRVEQTIQRMEVTSAAPGAADLAEKHAGVVLIFTLDSNYVVTKVEGFEAMLDKLAGDIEAVRKAIGTIVTPDIYSAFVDELFRTGPAKKLQPNDKWNRTHKQPLPGGAGFLDIESNYRLASATDDGQKVTWKATAKYTPPKKNPDALVVFTAGEMKAEEFAGEFLFDAKLGRLKSSFHKMKVDGTLTMSVSGTEIEVATKQTSSTTIDVSDKSFLKK